MNIALVAHDSRKKELIEWVKYNYKTLSEHKLFATGTTGKLIKEALEDADDSFESDEEKHRFYQKEHDTGRGARGLCAAPGQGDRHSDHQPNQ